MSDFLQVYICFCNISTSHLHILTMYNEAMVSDFCGFNPWSGLQCLVDCIDLDNRHALTNPKDGWNG